MTKRIALAYSGDLDASAILKWIKETSPLPVVALVADLGQAEDVGALSRKATKTGADKVVLADLKDEFARDYVFPALKSGAGADLALGPALARAHVVRVLLKVAKSEGCDALAFGSAGRPDESARTGLALRALAPDFEVFPVGLGTRAEVLAYAQRNGLEAPAVAVAAESSLMQAVAEGGPLDDPWAEPPAELFKLTADPAQAPDVPEFVELEFADGVPTALNKEPLSPSKLFLKLNPLAGKHGVGRSDAVENRPVAGKVRCLIEAPGFAVLQLAHRAVEALTMDREAARLRDALLPQFVSLVTSGLWFSPEMAVLRAALDETQKGVTGVARIRLCKGLAAVAGRRSPNSLYNAQPAGGDAVDVGALVRATGQRLAQNKSLRKGV